MYMNGAMADPLENMIRAPKNSRQRMIGSIQYFLRSLRNPQRSFRKSII